MRAPPTETAAANAKANDLTVKPAVLDFGGGRPFSPAFGDIYFDADGPDETLRVFVSPADIEARARAAERFTVAELGFGTGLNFLVTAACARAQHLHFVSFERHPLRPEDAARALLPWRRDFPIADDLLRAWPLALAGWHRRHFAGGRIQLSVWHGDVAPGLHDFAQGQRCGVDAWYLDGFAPNRNPAMWEPRLFRHMASCSRTGATVTTFTAAGQVRRDLAAAGFETRRVDQRPHKRHSTAAVLRGAGVGFTPPKCVNVLGAGLAGTSVARSLAEKGVNIALIDNAGGATSVSRASSVPAAVLHGRLLAGTSPEARLRAHAFAYSAERLKGLPGTRQTGALQVPGPNASANRLRRIAAALPTEMARLLDGREACAVANLALPDIALHCPTALTVEGATCVRNLSRHSRIEFQEEPDPNAPTVLATGASASAPSERSGRFSLRENCEGEFASVRRTKRLSTAQAPSPFDYLELIGIGGQMDLFRIPDMPALPVVGRGSFVPTHDGLWVGATYEHSPWPAGDAERGNAKRLQDCTAATPGRAIGSFRAIRAVTSDRLPIIGADAKADRVWFSLGHGSHGTVTAPFGGECIASQIVGEAAPADMEMLELVAPHRFQTRQLRRPNPFRNSRER